MTGGQVNADWSAPDGTAVSWGVLPPITYSGWNYNVSQPPSMLVGPGTAVSVVQSTALTAGGATVRAEIWAL